MPTRLADLIDPAAKARLYAAAGMQTKTEAPGHDGQGADPLTDLPTDATDGLAAVATDELGDDAVDESKGDAAPLEHKGAGTATQVLETNDETGLVRALVSVTGIEDRVKDVIEPGAYKATIAELEPIGVWSHDDKTWVARAEHYEELPPGHPIFDGLKTMDRKPWPKEAGAVLVDARFNLDTPHGAAAYSDVKFFKGKTGWSIGYKATKARRNPRTGVRHITELKWYEFSPVMVGAASQAMTLSVKSMADAYRVDPDDPTGLVSDVERGGLLTADELARKAALDLELKARIVRSARGAARYGVSIGSPVPKGRRDGGGGGGSDSPARPEQGAGGATAPRTGGVRGAIATRAAAITPRKGPTPGKDARDANKAGDDLRKGETFGDGDVLVSLSGGVIVTNADGSAEFTAPNAPTKKIDKAELGRLVDMSVAGASRGLWRRDPSTPTSATTAPAKAAAPVLKSGDRSTAGNVPKDTKVKVLDQDSATFGMTGVVVGKNSDGQTRIKFGGGRIGVIRNQAPVQLDSEPGASTDAAAAAGSGPATPAPTGRTSAADRPESAGRNALTGDRSNNRPNNGPLSETLGTPAMQGFAASQGADQSQTRMLRDNERHDFESGRYTAGGTSFDVSPARLGANRNVTDPATNEEIGQVAHPDPDSLTRNISWTTGSGLGKAVVRGTMKDALTELAKQKRAAATRSSGSDPDDPALGPQFDASGNRRRDLSASERAKLSAIAADPTRSPRDRLAASAANLPPLRGTPGRKDGDLDLDVKGSRASLDRSPGTNWIEASGGQLPGYIREVARALEREQAMPLSKAIPIAISRIKAWARGGDGVKADTMAKAVTALAAWEALKARNALRGKALDYDSELLDEFAQHVGLEDAMEGKALPGFIKDKIEARGDGDDDSPDPKRTPHKFVAPKGGGGLCKKCMAPKGAKVHVNTEDSKVVALVEEWKALGRALLEAGLLDDEDGHDDYPAVDDVKADRKPGDLLPCGRCGGTKVDLSKSQPMCAACGYHLALRAGVKSLAELVGHRREVLGDLVVEAVPLASLAGLVEARHDLGLDEKWSLTGLQRRGRGGLFARSGSRGGGATVDESMGDEDGPEDTWGGSRTARDSRDARADAADERTRPRKADDAVKQARAMVGADLKAASDVKLTQAERRLDAVLYPTPELTQLSTAIKQERSRRRYPPR